MTLCLLQNVIVSLRKANSLDPETHKLLSISYYSILDLVAERAQFTAFFIEFLSLEMRKSFSVLQVHAPELIDREFIAIKVYLVTIMSIESLSLPEKILL